MRNVDQGAGTLGESFTQQVGRTVLRDDVLCLETGGHHAGAGVSRALILECPFEVVEGSAMKVYRLRRGRRRT